MGHTLDAWLNHVNDLLPGTDADLDPGQIETVGILPAITKFSIDRPHRDIVEAAGAGSNYFGLPAGWVDGFSSLVEVEFPARQQPRQMLDDQSWTLVRSAADATVHQILLDRTPASSQYVRLTFTRPWPFPTTVASDDLLNDLAYESVVALAASKCLTSLASQAALSRAGGMPTDFSDGRQRAANLLSAAEQYLSVYESFIGVSGKGGDPNAPAYGAFDFDAQWAGVFHGGRR